MSTVTHLPVREHEAVPADTFPIRLAIVRAAMGWNYDQAAAATGINSETWRLWEKGKRRCTDVVGVAAKITKATGYSSQWLVMGGALGPEGGPGSSVSSGWSRRRRAAVAAVRSWEHGTGVTPLAA